jgi:hypothetical protein
MKARVSGSYKLNRLQTSLMMLDTCKHCKHHFWARLYFVFQLFQFRQKTIQRKEAELLP